MKLFTFLMAASLMTIGVSRAELSDVKAVYLLPMSGALDQYLAIRLTSGGTFQVVTDPQKADAIFTDRIGANLEGKLAELYDPQPTDKQKNEVLQEFSRPTMQPIGRGQGNIFLVDRKTRTVLWGTFEKPKGSTPDDMKRVANQIAGRLEKNLKAK